MAAATEATGTMKAIVRRRWGRARDVVELVDMPRPETADDEVLVRVHARSINRSDYYALGGAAILTRPLQGGFLRPKTERIGGDFACIAEAVGKDVTGIQPGDEVYGTSGGSWAEYAAARAERLGPSRTGRPASFCLSSRAARPRNSPLSSFTAQPSPACSGSVFSSSSCP